MDSCSIVFMDMLRDKGLKADTSFMQALPLIANDKRYRAVKTLAQRKSLFAQWSEEKREEERVEKVQELENTKSNFVKLLERDRKISSSTKFEDLVVFYRGDSAFNEMVETIGTFWCQELLGKYIDRLLTMEQTKRHEEILENEKIISKLIQELLLRPETQWRDIKPTLGGSKAFELLGDSVCHQIFTEQHSNLVHNTQQQEYLQREERRKVEVEARNGFRQMLREITQREALYPGVDFDDAKILFEDDLRYKSLFEILKSSPKAIYQQFMAVLHDKVAFERSVIRESASSSPDVFESSSQWFAYLEGIEEYLKLDSANRKIAALELYHLCLQSVGDFKMLLKEAIPFKVPYELASKRLEGKFDFSRVEEDRRRLIFEEYVKDLPEPELVSDEEEGALPDEEYDESDKLIKQDSLLTKSTEGGRKRMRKE